MISIRSVRRLMITASLAAVAAYASASPPVVIYGRAIEAKDIARADALTSVEGDVTAWVDASYEPTAKEVRSWGAKTVYAYLNGGAWEEWRPGAKKWAKENPGVIGHPYEGWPGENWLDIRSPKVRDYLRQRMAKIAIAGYDGVDIDNLDSWQHKTKFPLKPSDCRAHVEWLAATARGMNLKLSLRHCNPTWAKPDAWLIESGVSQGWSGRYSGYVVCLEYGPPKSISRPGCWVVFADRSLKRNHAAALARSQSNAAGKLLANVHANDHSPRGFSVRDSTGSLTARGPKQSILCQVSKTRHG